MGFCTLLCWQRHGLMLRGEQSGEITAARQYLFNGEGRRKLFTQANSQAAPAIRAWAQCSRSCKAHGSTPPRIRFAMSGTDILHDSTRHPSLRSVAKT
eukprot:381189-Rhodomonas_salina.3